MRIEDILYKLIATVAATPAPVQAPPTIIINNITGPSSDKAPEPAELVADPDVMIPPLQLKIEMQKKATGIESAYDQQCEECNQMPCQCPGKQDELAILKRNAGLSALYNDGDGPLDV